MQAMSLNMTGHIHLLSRFIGMVIDGKMAKSTTEPLREPCWLDDETE